MASKTGTAPDKDNLKEKDTLPSSAKDTKEEKGKDKSGANPSAKVYRYTTEISQMCYVFDHSTPSEPVLHYIEDTVRLQLVDFVLAARAQAARRASRQVAVEDLLFLIRNDKGKVARLRTFLGWGNVRRKIKGSEMEEMDDLMDLTEEPKDDKVLQMEMSDISLPWDVQQLYSLPGDVDSEELHRPTEDSLHLLKKADESTRSMNAAQYNHYSECRQASFTYPKVVKGKRFRDFLSLSTTLEGPPPDEVIEVLSFLAYELVRSLCSAGQQAKLSLHALRVKEALEREAAKKVSPTRDDVKDEEGDSTMAAPPVPPSNPTNTTNANPKKRKDEQEHKSSSPRPLVEPLSLFSEPLDSPETPFAPSAGPASPKPLLPAGSTTAASTPTPTPASAGAKGGAASGLASVDGLGLVKTSLQLEEVIGGFLATQQEAKKGLKGGRGMRDWRSGIKRARVGQL